MNNLNLFVVLSIAAATAMLGGSLVTPAFAMSHENMTMSMDNSSMPTHNMSDMTMSMDNSSMPTHNMSDMTMSMDNSTTGITDNATIAVN
jgi:hypothetical protein